MYLFFLAQGLSFTQIALLEVTYNVTTLVGEIPTGYVGDRVGRRASLLVGTVLIAGTLVGIGLAGSFPALVALYALWSTGYNFRSGSEDAWLYDTLVEGTAATDGGDGFAGVRGRGESVALAVGASAALVGGVLGSVDLSYPWFVAGGVTALGAVVLVTVEEPGGGEASTLSSREALEVVRAAVESRRLRAFVVYYYVLYAGATYLVFVYLQPVFETVVVDLGVAPGRVESLLGGFYAAYSLVGAAISYFTGAIRERVGVRTWFLVLPFAVGGALVAMAAVPVLALPTFLVVRGLSDVTRSFASQYVNDGLESVARATVLSAMAMVSGLAVVPFQLASGVVADAVSPLVALGGAGAVLVVGAALVRLLAEPVVYESW
jgi:MFS family permease